MHLTCSIFFSSTKYISVYLFLDYDCLEWCTISGLTWVRLLFGLAGQCCAKPSQCWRSGADCGHDGAKFSSSSSLHSELCDWTVWGLFTWTCSHLAWGSIVATVQAACLPSSPLIDQHACFSFPWSGKANWGTFDSLCFLGPQAHSWGRSALKFLWGNVGHGEMGFLPVGAVYEGGWAVCQHSKSCCQGNSMYNWPSVYVRQQKQTCCHIFL